MDHTIALIEKVHQGDEQAKAQLVEENTGLVWCVVKRFLHRGTEAEDLFQIGSIGLLKAIDKFDTSYQVKFSTYAVPLIAGELKRFLRDDGMIKVSRSLKELSARAYACRERMRKQWGREPTLAELAELLQVEAEELASAMEASAEVESLHRPVYEKDGHEIPLMDQLEEQDRREEAILNHMVLGELLKHLSGKDRKLIYLRYFVNKTQTEIGKIMGISQVQVSRAEKRILKQMREVYFRENDPY